MFTYDSKLSSCLGILHTHLNCLPIIISWLALPGFPLIVPFSFLFWYLFSLCKWFQLVLFLCFSLTRSYVQRKRRYRKSGSNLTFSMLKKELRDGNLQSLLRASQSLVSSSNAEPDPLLSSFMYNRPVLDEPASVKPHLSLEASSIKDSSLEDSSERYGNFHWLIPKYQKKERIPIDQLNKILFLFLNVFEVDED